MMRRSTTIEVRCRVVGAGCARYINARPGRAQHVNIMPSRDARSFTARAYGRMPLVALAWEHGHE